MAVVLSDPSLYMFTGGDAPSPADLALRYQTKQVGRSDDGEQTWRNWIARLQFDGAAIDYVQSTIQLDTNTAEIAWVIGSPWQGKGYAVEAAHGMIKQMAADGAGTIVAHIHSEHHASRRVATALHFWATGRMKSGEEEWALVAPWGECGRTSEIEGCSSGN